MLKEELNNALSQKGERVATRFLKKHPEIVVYTFNWTAGHCQYVLNEFMLGSRYKVDFVVLLAYSGKWEVNFIELENTDDNIITKDGKPSQRLNSAISQIHDWNEYIIQNKASVQRDLSKACMEKDLLKWVSSEFQPSNNSGNKLSDPETFITFKYHVIIGRRFNIADKQRRKMNQYSMDIAQIGSYDRFLDVAGNYDRHHANPNESVLLTETRGF